MLDSGGVYSHPVTNQFTVATVAEPRAIMRTIAEVHFRYVQGVTPLFPPEEPKGC